MPRVSGDGLKWKDTCIEVMMSNTHTLTGSLIKINQV